MSGRRRRRLARTFLGAATATLVLLHGLGSGASDHDDQRTQPPQATAIGHTGTSVHGDVAQPVLFAGHLIVEGIHGFSTAEVSRVRQIAPGTFTVSDGEIYIRYGTPPYDQLPLDTLVTTPEDYAAAAGNPTLAHALTSGVVLAASTARLTHLRAGDRIQLAGGVSLPITAVVDDTLTSGFQVATGRTTPVGLGDNADYLVLPSHGSTAALESAVQRALPNRRLRFVNPDGTHYFSASGDVLSQSQLDDRFGMFTVRRTAAGFVQDPSWVAGHVIQRDLPQLGVVSCNRVLMPYLTAAMDELTRRGLGRLINTADFQYEGGCWNSRTARFEPGQISHHAWGCAIDLNVAANPLGAVPHQDPRLVAIMAEHGFTWGGRWLRRDGNHFEWVGAAGATIDS
jgi:hypothetical protein